MSDIHADQCYATAIVRCQQLVHPHEGDHIYGKPGEPMPRLTPMADNVHGFTGTVIHPEVSGATRVWRCPHTHRTVDGAKACAAYWCGRCARCEGTLEEVAQAGTGKTYWRCAGNQILGPCGYSLDPARLTEDVEPSLESALRGLIEAWTAGADTSAGTYAGMLEEILNQHKGL